MTKTILAIAGAMLAASSASAADFSFTGTLARDNGKALFSFTVTTPSTVTLRSLGYAGGTNAAGNAIARGGFDSALSLYGSDGVAIDFNDDGLDSTPDSVTGAQGDSVLITDLAAGTYSVYLTQYSNFGPMVIPGEFAFDNEPDFRGGFIDFYGDQRTGAYAFDILGVDTAVAVPEPATWAMMILGVAVAGGSLRVRRRNMAVRFA